jgi:hypothetical protein
MFSLKAQCVEFEEVCIMISDVFALTLTTVS